MEAALEGAVQQLSTLAWTPPASSLPHDLLCLSSHLPHTLGFGHTGLVTVPQLTKPLLLLLPFSGGAIASHIHKAHFLTLSFSSNACSLVRLSQPLSILCSRFTISILSSSLSSSSLWYYCYVTLEHGFICLLPSFHWNVSLNKGGTLFYSLLCRAWDSPWYLGSEKWMLNEPDE